MKKGRFISLLTVALIAWLPGNAQSKVLVKITNLPDTKGVCRACLFDSEASFNGKGKPLQCVEVPAKDKTVLATFDHVAAGTYAVSVFHDVNNNNKLDLNFLG